MKSNNILNILVPIIIIGATIAAASGLFYSTDGFRFSFMTIRGREVQILGSGLYRFDTVFFGAGFRGQDAVVLFLGVPLLLVTWLVYRNGSQAGPYLLTGMLGYFLYIYASMALGAAYNPLFLLYIVLFSASLFGFIHVFNSIKGPVIKRSHKLPRVGLMIFMVVAGVVTLVVWGGPLLAAVLKGGAPERMDSYTTMVTYALDLAVITPATFMSAYLIYRYRLMGYAIAAPLLTLVILLAPQILLSTLWQKAAGVPFTTGEMIGPVAGFVVLGLTALGLYVALLRALFRAA
ncbi:MAG: hypothetical protein GF313_08790 [Caldithrix sp.]|nr:hypothetical protein [Caldithrix sp.]